MTAEDINKAVKRAKEVLLKWKEIDFEERTKLFENLKKVIKRKKIEITRES